MKKRKVVKGIHPVEKIYLTIILMLLIVVPVSVVFSKAALSKSNIEVERLKSKVTKQSKTNQSLSMQVDELASLSNIQDVAKQYGLSYNNDNIIVIED